MEILKGADVVAAINEELQDELKKFGKEIPHLAIIRVGERPDDIAYERGAMKRLNGIGLKCSNYIFPETITHEEFTSEFKKVNEDKTIDGILLLRPLPKQIDEKAIETLIDPQKDIDGISPMNLAKVFAGDDTAYAPCTAEAVIEMIDFAGIDLTGKRVTVVGRSLVVGKPLAMLLLKKNATVTICHTKTKEMENTCKNAEVIIAAAGKAKMLNDSYVGKNAIVIDVGINMDENNKLCGDVDFETIKDIAAMATPVPGGVGTVTTSVLAKHLIKAAKLKKIF
ncbi:bifunctional 5,10-methylenetetrahydrofolate dehydrogenase/5,10-methenyltetrahydrofolate cyclohydrolase [Anaerosacchariphilus polymeriproducens]|uniref:Bifunctional protein FolD n=1 Tax=Anaerosacchariphilus polymeriproducens TaxID=1812858 RepID=A0A371AXT9_9FIRM|nr:bifunctional 5,10-methylenetetrahydrofolate dehydrogenase/5,10-methenyltetrahydrofolate cyclohydrolase [Anaerosacchariphilus polymeriproducens]RDU24393.1 bifunctional 5,10-methylenetetrahydrofolate dehydrogenase/5,10-methenyltetrahydrofolate cyclohydrolase [Anaerosacchariphilus polymeriproducens]